MENVLLQKEQKRPVACKRPWVQPQEPYQSGMAVHVCNPSTPEAGARGVEIVTYVKDLRSAWATLDPTF